MSEPAEFCIDDYRLSDLKPVGDDLYMIGEYGWQRKLDFITEQVEFCGCGMPAEALRFVVDGLAFIEREGYPDNWYLLDEWRKKYGAEESRLFPDCGSRYFFFYWASAKDFEEHGGSTPGWLTERGKNFLADAREVLAEIDA